MNLSDRMLRILLLVCLAVNIGLAVANYSLHQRFKAQLARLNAAVGCDGTEPKVVPFVQGMALCPGQEARGAFVIPLPPGFALPEPPATVHRQQGQEM